MARATVAATHATIDAWAGAHHATTATIAHARKPTAMTAPTIDSRSSGVLRERLRVATTSASSFGPVTRRGISTARVTF